MEDYDYATAAHRDRHSAWLSSETCTLLRRDCPKCQRPQPSVGDLVRLAELEEEIISCYLTLTDRSLTRREKEALRLGRPPSQDGLAWIIAGQVSVKKIARQLLRCVGFKSTLPQEELGH